MSILSHPLRISFNVILQVWMGSRPFTYFNLRPLTPPPIILLGAKRRVVFPPTSSPFYFFCGSHSILRWWIPLRSFIASFCNNNRMTFGVKVRRLLSILSYSYTLLFIPENYWVYALFSIHQNIKCFIIFFDWFLKKKHAIIHYM